MRSIVDRLSTPKLPLARIVLMVLVVLAAAPAGAQYVPPASFPPDSAYIPVVCGSPPVVAFDSCTDDARDHRNAIGGDGAPAFLYYQDGEYLFLRMRVEEDPRQGGAFVAFAWGFGIDVDGNGRFEAYITLIGQGMADRLEVRDQDPGNGTSPDRTLPTGGGTDTSLRPIDTTGAGPTWSTATMASLFGTSPNFCADRATPDWFVTVAVPLGILREFGALGGLIAYAGTSSSFTGIQNDFICNDGRAASCTTGSTCPSGVCLFEIGRCAPPSEPIFLGCIPEDSDGDGVDDGCTAAAPQCLSTGGSSRCVECVSAADCSDGNACTTEACSADACSFTPVGAGSSCPGGVCDAASAPMCVACIDDAAGTARDTGCTDGAPVCDTSGAAPFCSGCTTDADCDDANPCTTATCVGASCAVTSVPAGTSCPGGICNGSASAPECVPCVDDATGTGLDTGCAAAAPICDTSGATAQCVECTSATHCDDGNACTADACTSGACVTTPLAAGSVCPAGVCDGAATCGACIDDAAGLGQDTGCTAGAPVCDTSGAAPRCTGCIADADCDDGNECTADTCTAGSCVASSAPRGASCAGGVCNGSAVVPECVLCIDDLPSGMRDTGCTDGSPACDESGVSPQCTGCLVDADCDDRDPCTSDACAAGTCMASPSPAGVVCPTGVCDGDVSAPMCVACLDDAPDRDRDSGCPDTAPVCDASSAGPRCLGCTEDAHCPDMSECTTDACVDGGCEHPPVASGTPCSAGVCDAVEVSCERCVDGGAGKDPGCEASAPICAGVAGMRRCVECVVDGECPDGMRCDAPTGACTSGCDDASDCAAPTPVCDTGSRMCVECLDDGDCAAPTSVCDTGSRMCVECLDDGDCAAGQQCGSGQTCRDLPDAGAPDGGQTPDAGEQPRGGFSGGALCALIPGSAGSPVAPLLLLGVALCLVARRRRRR